MKHLKNCRYISIDTVNKKLVLDDVIIADEVTVETKNYVLAAEDLEVFTDGSNGFIYYVNKMDQDAFKESINLKTLRRSVAIKNIFSYDTIKPFDIFKFLPYLIIILLVFFK